MLVTLALAVPSYIAANTQAEQARNEAALARQEAEIAAQGQLTDRFSKAIEQLGTTENSKFGLAASTRWSASPATPNVITPPS
ncbi:hypothetical protein E1161_03240 [Saccharopolyspora aridisoli]|uniref:Uncharacterized protein n=1 Tax=Saccharopolyspora aridisoli TaxID=2530385 RepID=A0A4V2Y8G6_9PSEU|nr:hypothetical protein [Saccharopolyspora aridisoli]TDC95815.1 hypothetical protein E1161_03240 [Saccharopolyspora aridisoli]